MNVLLINYMETTSPGGINKVVLEIAKNLSKNGYNITVIQPDQYNLPNEEIYDDFKILRIKSTVGKILFGMSFSAFSYLKNYIIYNDIDLIHIHGYHTLFSLEAIYCIRKMNSDIPILFSPHSDIVKSTFIGRYFGIIYDTFFSSFIFKNVDKILSDSNFEANNIMKTFNINQSKIEIISLGVDFIGIKKGNVKLDRKIRLLFSGYLIDRKRVNFILNSLFYLVHVLKVTNVVLTIIGDGPERKDLLNLARMLNINEYVIWKNFIPRKELINEMMDADIFLLLSESEAYGIVVAESLALGTPCIVANTTALIEFTKEPGCFGVNYPPDPKETAELILKIYNDDVKVGPFSHKIRTWEMVTKDYESLYLKQISQQSKKSNL